VGEFSIVVATVAYPAVIDHGVFMMLVSAVIVTMVLVPYQVAGAAPIGVWVQRRLGRAVGDAAPTDAAPDDRPRVVIIGFGPAGQGVGYALVRKPVAVTVIEVNRRNVELAERLGFEGRIGDATHVEVLEHAQVARADTVVITLPDPATTRRAIELTRSLSGSARIVVRARHHVHRWELALAGADVVVDEEELVGERLAEKMNEHLQTVTSADEGD
jgi:CPA2 family monovalent cation:H+ antiporter-2